MSLKVALLKSIVLFLLIVLFYACNNDEKQGLVSNKAELLKIEIEPTSDITPLKTYIDTANGVVHVFVAENLSHISFPLIITPMLEVSEGATVVPGSGTPQTFSDPEDFVQYTIGAEDGENETIIVLSLRDKQIPNSGFENWFQETGMNSLPFPQPGKYAETTVWATINMGTSIYSIYGTSPLVEDGNTVVKIETVKTVSVPVVSGTLYNGKFNLEKAIAEPTNQIAAADLGIPFVGRPLALKFKYAYWPGAKLVQAVLKDPENLFGGFDIYELEGNDKFGIEVKLEKRIGGERKVIAQSNWESDLEVVSLTGHTLPLTYLSNEEPTHFYISFAPSFDGANFKGAVGSTLLIDDLELIYD